jgi:hypothetical protein
MPTKPMAQGIIDLTVNATSRPDPYAWTPIHTLIYAGSMSKRKEKQHADTGSERVIFTLPKNLTVELEEYARIHRNGNKSAFVADAIRSYIAFLRKRRHTQLLRQGYAQAAEQSRAINEEWEPLDDETWARLDQVKQIPKDRRR